MSLFWEYFTKTLKFLPLLKPGAAQVIVQGAAMALDDARTAVLWLRDQFLPEICDGAHLDAYAASRGLAKMAYETDEQFENRVRFAWAWHIIGGREQAIERIVTESMGTPDVTVLNMRDVDPDRWAEFRVAVEDMTGDALTHVPAAVDAIKSAKPARSLFAGLDCVINAPQATRYIGVSGFFSGAKTSVYPFSVGAMTIEAAQYFGTLIQTGHNSEILPYQGS